MEVRRLLGTTAAIVTLDTDPGVRKKELGMADNEITTREWIPRDEWIALTLGEGCAMCHEMASNERVNEWGITIADMDMGRLRLSTNQYALGYCILICKKHVREPHHLPDDEAARFYADITRAARAIEKVFEPDKMNILILGNELPHTHVHLVPRYHGDPAPGLPLDLRRYQKRLDSQLHYQRYADRIKRVLGGIKFTP